MRLHLIQSRDPFGPPDRQHELRLAWDMNDHVFTDQTHPEGRPTFTDLFALCKPDTINVIANSDIYFRRDNIALLTLLRWTDREAMALSRWDVGKDGLANLWDHADSQDAWIVYGAPHHIDAPFTMGVAGCDNALLHIIRTAGYTVTNPSRTIMAYHLHHVPYRSYLADPTGAVRGGNKIQRIAPPYAFCTPHHL